MSVKRRVGRPTIGETVKVTLPDTLKQYIDNLSSVRGERRGTTLRLIVTEAVRLLKEGHFNLPLPNLDDGESVEEKHARFGDRWITCGKCGEDYGYNDEHVCKPKRKVKK